MGQLSARACRGPTTSEQFHIRYFRFGSLHAPIVPGIVTLRQAVTKVFFLNFQIEPELGAGIDPGITPFLSCILDETRFEPTIFRL